MQCTTTTGPLRRPFIAAALPDLAWIILCPLIAWGALAALWRYADLGDAAVFAVLFAFVVTGHHMPGWLRAFGEPDVYAQHKVRLWVSLGAIPALVIVPTALGLGTAALFVAAMFDIWHVAMQQHGFGRIYGAKAGDVSPYSARLDLVCILVWYVTTVLWSDSWMYVIAGAFHHAGLPVFDLVSVGLWGAIRTGFAGLSGLLLVLFLAQLVAQRRRTGAVPWNKLLLHAVAFSVLFASYQSPSWMRALSVQNLFHALQYFFMVWIYARLSTARAPERPRAFYRGLFGTRRGWLAYLGLILLYGTGAWLLSSSTYRVAGFGADRLAQVLGSIGLASLLLHFYVDSFIWKVRSRSVQRTLAIDSADQETTTVETANPRRDALHAVGYFGVPMALVVAIGLGHDPEPTLAASVETATHQAALFPRSALARQTYGQAALLSGDVELARRELFSALALSPSLPGPAAELAELHRREGRTREWLHYARLAVRAEPRSATRHVELARALTQERETEEAGVVLERALALDARCAPALAELGLHAARRGDFDRAIVQLRRAREIDPDHWLYTRALAETLAAAGRARAGADEVATWLRTHPNDGEASLLEARLRQLR